MDNNSNNNKTINILFKVMIISLSAILASFILAKYTTLSKNKKKKILKISIIIYSICLLIGLLGVIFSAIEE